MMLKRYRIKSKFVDIKDGVVQPGLTYGNGTAVLAMWHEESGGRPEVLSINLQEYDFVAPEGHIYVKDYAEHEGLPDALAEAGVAEKVREVYFGPYALPAWLMRLTLEEE